MCLSLVTRLRIQSATHTQLHDLVPIYMHAPGNAGASAEAATLSRASRERVARPFNGAICTVLFNGAIRLGWGRSGVASATRIMDGRSASIQAPQEVHQRSPLPPLRGTGLTLRTTDRSVMCRLSPWCIRVISSRHGAAPAGVLTHV